MKLSNEEYVRGFLNNIELESTLIYIELTIARKIKSIRTTNTESSCTYVHEIILNKNMSDSNKKHRLMNVVLFEILNGIKESNLYVNENIITERNSLYYNFQSEDEIEFATRCIEIMEADGMTDVDIYDNFEGNPFFEFDKNVSVVAYHEVEALIGNYKIFKENKKKLAEVK